MSHGAVGKQEQPVHTVPLPPTGVGPAATGSPPSSPPAPGTIEELHALHDAAGAAAATAPADPPVPVATPPAAAAPAPAEPGAKPKAAKPLKPQTKKALDTLLKRQETAKRKADLIAGLDAAGPRPPAGELTAEQSTGGRRSPFMGNALAAAAAMP